MNPNDLGALIAHKNETTRQAAQLRWQLQRREDARSHGYRGPLTRDEASKAALDQLALDQWETDGGAVAAE